MQALKFLVIFMAVLITAAVAVIVVTLFNRSSGPSYRMGQAIPETTFPVPAGSRVVTMTASGEHLAVQLRDAAGQDQILLIDLRNGAPLSLLKLEPR
jgi:hypothetical protein